MSEEYEYDPFEYAQALAEGEDLGKSNLHEARRSADDEDRRGLTRRDLLVKGGLGAAASAVSPRSPAGGCQVAASRKFTGTLRVLSLGVEFPIPDIAKQASKDLGFTIKPILAPSEKQPQIAITSPDTFDVFGGYNYQTLQVWPSGGLQPVDTPGSQWNSCLRAVDPRQAQSGGETVHLRAGQRPLLATFVDRNGSTGLPPMPAARRAIGTSSAGSAKTASRSAASRSRAGLSARLRTSTRLDGLQRRVIKKRPEQVSLAELLNTNGRAASPAARPGHHEPGRGTPLSALGLLKIKD